MPTIKPKRSSDPIAGTTTFDGHRSRAATEIRITVFHISIRGMSVYTLQVSIQSKTFCQK